MNTEPQPRIVNSSPARARGFLRGGSSRGSASRGPEEDPAGARAPTRAGFASQRLAALGGREPGVLDRCGEANGPAVGPQLREPGQGRVGCWQGRQSQGQALAPEGQAVPPGSPAGPGGAAGRPVPGVLMEQAGSGRPLLTQSPDSRQSKQRAPTLWPTLREPGKRRREAWAGDATAPLS